MHVARQIAQAIEHGLHVNTGGRDKGVAKRLAIELGHGSRELFGGFALNEHLAHERIAVGMETARTQAHEHVAFHDAVGTDHLRAIDNAHGEARQVVIVGIHNAGVLGHFAADKRATRLTAAFRDAAHNLGDMFLLQLANGDIVQEEQGLGAARQNIVHAHGDQVDAHGVMLADELGDLELRAHAVGARNHKRLFHALECRRREQAAEASDIAHDLGTIRGMHGVFNGVDRSRALFDIDARVGVSDFCHG